MCKISWIPSDTNESLMSSDNQDSRARKELEGTSRGVVAKTAVVVARDRETNQVAAKVVASTNEETLQGFVSDHAASEATVYSDDVGAYETLPIDHDTVWYSLQEYVTGNVYSNGIESL